MDDNKHLIENYRGHDIYYDEDSEKFVCDISIEDNAKSTARISLKACRLEVDSFIKENLNFKPFKVMFFGDFDGSVEVRDAVGVRTDGALIIEYIPSWSVKKEVDRNYVKKNSHDADRMKKYNADFLKIADEWKEHEAIWKAKRKELQDKVKKAEKLIDWTYVEQFKKKV